MIEKLIKKLKSLKVNIGYKSLILIGVCILLILVDLITKICEEKYSWNFTVIPTLIEVSSGSRNPGCAFSFLSNAAWGQTFLIVTTFIMLVPLLCLFTFLPERFLLIKISLSLILAGAIGNLIDRIAFREVRDFVGINMLGNMVSCNFADFWIVFGTVIAIIDMMFLNELSVFPLTKKAKEYQAKNNKEAEVNSDNKEDGEA